MTGANRRGHAHKCSVVAHMANAPPLRRATGFPRLHASCAATVVNVRARRSVCRHLIRRATPIPSSPQIVMAGVLGIYGLIIAVIIANSVAGVEGGRPAYGYLCAASPQPTRPGCTHPPRFPRVIMFQGHRSPCRGGTPCPLAYSGASIGLRHPDRLPH